MPFRDKVGARDKVSVTLSTDIVMPKYPCPKCGAATSKHHPVKDDKGDIIEKRRICSNKNCRYLITEQIIN